ncbi:MAG: GntR family transcriptional regulator [Planctomycetota bacterium]|nr:GntR family transcriptional regulator [Planctomycetota bacterium]
MDTLAITRPETLKDLVYRKVKELLVTGRLPHDEIHSANQLADELGVSRTPVREALLQLSAEGFLLPLKGRGFQVRRFTRQEVKDLFEARRVIECHVAECLAARADLSLEPLNAALKGMSDAAGSVDLDAFMESDDAFHHALFKMHGNRLLHATLDNLRTCILLIGYTVLGREGRSQEVLAEHRAVAQALKKRDPQAAREAMRRHLEATEAQLLKVLEEDRGGARDIDPA